MCVCVCVFSSVLFIVAFVNVHVHPNRDHVTGGVCVLLSAETVREVVCVCVCCHLCSLFL